MNRSLTSWMLGGALAASLSWNWKQQACRTPMLVPDCAASSSCSASPASPASEKCCEGFDAGELGLGEEQRAELAEVCERSCGESDRLERKANELQQEVLSRLGRENVDESELKRLMAEVSKLREQSLAACVEGILQVREVLTAEQVSALLESCRSDCR